MKLLFLDIDGVLNDHNKLVGDYCGIYDRCVDYLNRIIHETDCKIVISSSWRYMIHHGAMTLRGFEYMLISHGIDCEGRLLGITAKDEDYPHIDSTGTKRAEQIKDFVNEYSIPETHYCVLDDGDLLGVPLVKTRGDVGLTIYETTLVCQMLANELRAIRSRLQGPTS